jgi:hypothetical protein
MTPGTTAGLTRALVSIPPIGDLTLMASPSWIPLAAAVAGLI